MTVLGVNVEYNINTYTMYLSKNGHICTNSLIDVDGDVVGANLLRQTTSSLFCLGGRVYRTHVTRGKQLPVVWRTTLHVIMP